MSLSLVPSNHSALWSVAKDVTDFNEAKVLSAQMIDLMNKSGGVGLAAPQVGLPLRLIVTDMKDLFDKNHVFINPIIINHGKNKIRSYEGCLSFPNEKGKYVDRWEIIDVQYQNLAGKTFKIAYKRVYACILQHEIDHLNGICIYNNN